MTMTTKPNDTRHSVVTPDGGYRYQLAISATGKDVENLFTVWEWPDDGSVGWKTVAMIMVDESGYGPQIVGDANGVPSNPPPEDGASRALVQAYMRAAGHIWAARTAGLWNTEPEGQ
jgi:hypothetical protein